MADLAPEEEPIPVVDFGPAGPPRCERCKAYVNPYFQFVENGRRMRCNLCQFASVVRDDYFCNLDGSGRRMDVMQRPELLYGTVEFAAPKEYCARAPKPARFLFVLDVSAPALVSGMLEHALAGIRAYLYPRGPPDADDGVEIGRAAAHPRLPAGAEIGFLTFDRALHFYNVSAGLEGPQMLVVSDVDDVFAPLQRGVFVDPVSQRALIEQWFDQVPKLFSAAGGVGGGPAAAGAAAGAAAAESVFGAAMQAAHLLLKETGGRILTFAASLPVVGPGALKYREDRSVIGTDKERQLFEPADYFYVKLGHDLSADGICVSLFLCPKNYVDVATLGVLATLTGGDTTHYMSFEGGRDGDRLRGDVQNALGRTFAYDALLRIRTSNHLKPQEYFGNFCMRNATDMELAGCDALRAFACSLRHDGKLVDRDASFQAALLYTTGDGQRRIRLHNLVTPVTTEVAQVFKMADLDAIVNVTMKAAISRSVTVPLKEVRESLNAQCVRVLVSYRKHCAASASPGQLILPESCKLYPIYCLAMLKRRAFRTGNMSSDVRVASMRFLKSMAVEESVAFLYPRMVQLTQMDPQVGQPVYASAVSQQLRMQGVTNVPKGIRMPTRLRLSYERMRPDAAYFVENGVSLFLWLGAQLPATWLQDVLGVGSLEAVDLTMRRLPVRATPLSQQVRAVQRGLARSRNGYMPLQVVRQGMDQFLELEFGNMLVEDQNLDNMNYVDYLCAVHRNVQNELADSR